MDQQRFSFWGMQQGWPNDTASHVFLARAVHAVGKSLFPQEWSGREPVVEKKRPLPERKIEGWTLDARAAHHMLVRFYPEFGRPPVPPNRSSGPYAEFTDEEWEAATSAIAKANAEIGPAIQRFLKVQQEIIRLAECEKLSTAVRPIAGGDPSPIHRSLWNSEKIFSRFTLCRMNPQDPFSNGFAGDKFQWIFVTRESLEKCLSALAGSSQSESAETAALEPESTPPEVATPKPRGRKPGDGSYGPLDLPILDEMKELISSRRAASPEEAARLLAGKAHGAGSPESKAERLAKRYRRREFNSLGSGS
jgi:hypothetical protein